MASVENRSKIQVSVKNRDDLTKTFEYSADKAIKAYVEQLKAQGYKPKLASLNNRYAIRARQVGYPDLCLFAASEEEALELKQRIKSEMTRGQERSCPGPPRSSFGLEAGFSAQPRVGLLAHPNSSFAGQDRCSSGQD